MEEIGVISAKLIIICIISILLFTIIWGLPEPILFFDPTPGFVWLHASNWFVSGLLFIVIILFGIIFHEFIHAVFFLPFLNKKFKGITFGFNKINMAPYVHIKDSITFWGYRLGVVMPFLILGIIPLLTGLIKGHFFTLLFGLFMKLIAAGDLMLLKKTSQIDSNYLIQDLPNDIGFIAIKKFSFK